MDLNLHQIVNLGVAAVAAYVLFAARHRLLEAFDQMRGGPRPPTHPLPGNDAFIVLRKRKRRADL